MTPKKATAAPKMVEVLAHELPAVIDFNITDAALAELAEKYSNLPADLSDKDNYRATQDAINDLRSYRPKIKDKGKNLKAEALAWQKKVVAEEKRLDDAICAMLNPLAERKKAYDDKIEAEKEARRKAEQARKDAHLDNINKIRLLISEAQGKNSEGIELVIAKLEGILIDHSFEEFEKEALGVYDDTDFALRKMLLDAQAQEEADRKRADEDARLKAEREAIEKEKAELAEIRRKNAELQTQELTPAAAPTEEKTALRPHANVSPPVQTKISNENAAINQAENNTLQALAQTLCNMPDMGYIDMAEGMLRAIKAGKIPNVKYSIF